MSLYSHTRKKTKIVWFASILCALVGLSCTAITGDRFWRELTDGDTASTKGDYTGAEKHYRNALASADNDSNRATALHYLGVSLLSQDKLNDAEGTFKTEVETAERAYGSAHPRLFDALSDITLLYIRQRRWADAERYNQRALLIARNVSREENKAGVELTETLRDVVRDKQQPPPK